VWTVSAAVIRCEAGLDYRSTAGAIGVCIAAWLLSFGLVWSALIAFSTNVS
jgi:hypothetical protein